MGRAGFIAARPRDDVLTVPGVLNANPRWPDQPTDDRITPTGNAPDRPYRAAIDGHGDSRRGRRSSTRATLAWCVDPPSRSIR
jgi:hypothetical protein